MISWQQRRNQRRERIYRKMANMRAAKERKRLAAHADDPPIQPPDPRPLWIMTIQGRETVHRLVAFQSNRRTNAVRVVIDGKEWKKSIGLTRIVCALRKKIATAI